MWSEAVFIGPDEESSGEIRLASRQIHAFDGQARVLPIRQYEMITLDVHRTQGQHLRHARAGRPQHPQQEAVALARGRVDDRLHVLRREPLGWLPALVSGSNRSRVLARI